MLNWLRALLVLLVFSETALAADVVEFLNGSKLSGAVKAIDKEAKEFQFEAKIGARSTTRTYAFQQVHAVTFQGKRFVLTPMDATASVAKDSDGNLLRSRTEVASLIQNVGSTDPDWFATTPLEYPDTLDLSWPIKPEGKWNNRKNMGQYIWDVINPNPSKWRSGIKLVHHCLSLHQDDRELLERDQTVLGRMYFELLQDYPRAAYWLKKAGVTKGQNPSVMLAECYFRLGNRSLAQPYLASRTYNAGAAARAIKLYGNMGQLDDALAMTQRLANTTASYQGFIAAGDALREAGQYEQAIAFYNRVLTDDNFRNDDYESRFKARARESIEAIEMFEQVDIASISDGTYQGHSTGYNGRLDVAVGVESGEIKSVKVTAHQEKQFYSALTDTENSILKLQTVKGVDGTSGATITSRAIVNATAKALAEASR